MSAPLVVVSCSGGAAALAVGLVRSPRWRALVALLAAASTALGLVAVGAPLPRAVVTATATVVGGVLALLVAERLLRRRARRSPSAVTAWAVGPWVFADLGLAAVGGGAGALGVGRVLALVAGLPAPQWAAYAWALGAASSAYLALVVLALLRHGGHHATRPTSALEHTAVWGVLALSFTAHAVAPAALPLAVASVLGVLWSSLRLPARAVALHLLASCAAVVALSTADLSATPFSALLTGTHTVPVASRTVADVMVMTGGQASLAQLALVVLVVTSVREALLSEQARTAAAVELARRAEHTLAGVLDGATEQAVISLAPDLEITLFSAGAERMLGWSAAEAVGRRAWMLAPPGDHDDVAVAVEAVLLLQSVTGSATTPHRVARKGGSSLEVLLSLTPRRSADGVLEGYVAVLTDVSALRAAESALSGSDQVYRAAFETAPTGLVLIGLAAGQEGRVLRVNQSFAAFTGRTEAELLQLRIRDLLDPRDVDAHLTYLVRAAGGGEPEPLGVERRFTTPSGEVRHARKSTSVIRPDGEHPYLLAVIEDTTAQRAAEDALVRLAMHDPLTDLPNRALLGDRLERALTADVRQRVGVTVVYADLDGFKPVNDSHGHAAGDLLLTAVAERLSSAVRAGDTVARLGGDEFAVLCPGLGVEQVPVVLARIQRAVAPPVRLPGGVVVRVGLSTGTATVVGGGDPARLLDEADQAMFAAKRRRRAERTAAREDAERLAGRIDERRTERAAERTARRAGEAAAGSAPTPRAPQDPPLELAVADSTR